MKGYDERLELREVDEVTGKYKTKNGFGTDWDI